MDEQKRERKPMTTFVVALPLALRRQVRVAAAVRDQTISEFVLGVIARELERDQPTDLRLVTPPVEEG